MGPIKRSRGRILTVVLGAVAVALFLGASAASASHHWYRFEESKCYAFDTNYGQMMRGRVKFTMGTYPHKKNNLRSVQMKARFIPADEPGHNWHRNWSSVKYEQVDPDGANNVWLRVTTHPERTDKDWSLEVKLKWDRVIKRDWHVHRIYGWREGFCESSGPFRSESVSPSTGILSPVGIRR